MRKFKLVDFDQIEVINLKISKGMYIRFNGFISKIGHINTSKKGNTYVQFKQPNGLLAHTRIDNIDKASFNIIDLIEYMDLLEIENPIKLYGENKTIALFNPVRCDGFTEFEDGTHCIILNLDYLVDVKDLKIKSVLTKEQFNAWKYVVERDK